MNKTAMNMYKFLNSHIYFYSHIFSLILGKYQRLELLSYMLIVCLTS